MTFWFLMIVECDMGKLLDNSQVKHAPLCAIGNFLKSVKFPLKGVPFIFENLLFWIPLTGKQRRLNLAYIV